MAQIAGRSAAAFAAALCGAIVASGCSAPSRPSVLLIVIDSLRRDHVGTYGYAAPTTPEIDAFADSARTYTNAYSTAPWTTPAVASLLTSQLGSSLGIHRGSQPLPEDRLLLSEALQAAGYFTGAVVSHSYIGAKWNFDQGFDVFEERIVPAAASNAPEVTDAAIELLESDRPFFLLVHYFDVHFPYLEHEGFEMRRSDAYSGVVHSGLPWTYAKALAKKLDDSDVRELIRFYDSEIAFTDAEVGRLLRALDERGLSERTLVIITSDHGEAFLERGRLGHTLSLYDELVAIPLVVRYPGGQPGRDDRLVSLVDLYPTVLDVVGIGPPEGLTGASLLAAGDAPGVVRSETSRGVVLRGVIAGRFKLVRDLGTGRDALYDRRADPSERNDLAGLPEHADTLRRLARSIDRWPRALAASKDRVLLGEAEHARLRALGYVDD